jgi:tRNA 2-thiouridine synthesizing protein A
MTDTPHDRTLDARGLACPMPIVKSRQAIKELEPGQVLKVVATDPGSVNDFQGWAQAAKSVELVAQETAHAEGRDLYVHYVRRTA